MWNSQNTFFDADLGYAMRLVRTGNATVEQAAATCGVSLTDLQAMLSSCPQLQLQQVQFSR